MDVRGALGLSDEVRNGFERIRVAFLVEGDAPPEKLRELVERAKARSAVFDMVTNGVPVDVGVDAEDDARRPVRPGAARLAGQSRPSSSAPVRPGSRSATTSARRSRARPARARPRRSALARALGLAHAALAELDEPPSRRAGRTRPERFPRPDGRSIAYLEAYARSFDAPVLEGRRGQADRATSASLPRRHEPAPGSPAASCSRPATPRPRTPHSRHRRASPPCIPPTTAGPSSLPDGPLLVVGAGASGQQLALELAGAGRDVVLAVGRHSRAPRRSAAATSSPGSTSSATSTARSTSCPDLEAAKRVPLFPLSGANGGEDLGLDRLARTGIAITGRLRGFDGRRAVFADDLAGNLAAATRACASSLRRIDAHPLAPATERAGRRRARSARRPRTVDLRRLRRGRLGDGIPPCLPVAADPGVLDEDGEIVQQPGATPVPGLYVLGLAYQSPAQLSLHRRRRP